jgi:peptidoglycan/xylan/chitin deacetylase (PgdA/CDA1 family)
MSKRLLVLFVVMFVALAALVFVFGVRHPHELSAAAVEDDFYSKYMLSEVYRASQTPPAAPLVLSGFKPVAEVSSTTTAETGPTVRVPILVYHSVRPYRPTDTPFDRQFIVDPADFDRQLSYLEDNGYADVTFADLDAAIAKGASLPPKPVIISLDDGWANQFQYALPLLQKHHLQATFFIYTGVIGHKHYLTWDQVLALEKSGMIIAGHSVTHPYLTKITDDKVLRHEIVDGKKIIETHLGHAISYFAYPFGLYDDRVEAVVQDAGYVMARTIHHGVEHSQADIYTLSGNIVTGDFGQFLSMLK